MNQLLGHGQKSVKQSGEPNTMIINIELSLGSSILKMNISVDPDIPFNDFVKGILEYSLKKKPSQFMRNYLSFIYSLKVKYIKTNSEHYRNWDSKIIVHYLLDKNQEDNIKQKYQLMWIYNSKNMDFIQNHYHIRLFHRDIYKYKIQVNSYFKFFSGQTEIDPFNCWLRGDHLQEGIDLKIIPRNKTPTQNEIEIMNFIFTNKLERINQNLTYRKIRVSGYDKNIGKIFYDEQLIPLDTPKDEVYKHLKFKIFGPNHDKLDLEVQGDDGENWTYISFLIKNQK